MIGYWRSSRPHIEEATPADAAALADMHERSFDRGWSPEDMRSMIADHPIVQPLILRVRTGTRTRPAGFVILRVAGGEAEILTVAVEPARRGRGYGRLLMEEAMRRAYRERAQAVFLEVDEANRAAVALYRSLGFETVGSRSRYYEHREGTAGDALVMRLTFGYRPRNGAPPLG